MVEGPFGLARKRLGRSIEFRVQNATRVIVDQLRTDLDFRLATMHTEQQVAGLLS